MTNMPISVQKDPAAQEAATRKAQSLRLRRFAMAVATYAVVTFAAFLATRLGLGRMSAHEWATFIGIGLAGNIIFFALIYTGVNLRFSDPSLTREQIVYSAAWGLVPMYALPEVRPIILMFYVPAFSFGMLRLTRDSICRWQPALWGFMHHSSWWSIFKPAAVFGFNTNSFYSCCLAFFLRGLPFLEALFRI